MRECVYGRMNARALTAAKQWAKRKKCITIVWSRSKRSSTLLCVRVRVQVYFARARPFVRFSHSLFGFGSDDAPFLLRMFSLPLFRHFCAVVVLEYYFSGGSASHSLMHSYLVIRRNHKNGFLFWPNSVAREERLRRKYQNKRNYRHFLRPNGICHRSCGNRQTVRHSEKRKIERLINPSVCSWLVGRTRVINQQNATHKFQYIFNGKERFSIRYDTILHYASHVVFSLDREFARRVNERQRKRKRKGARNIEG